MSNEIPVVFHNGSNYHHHFIIKQLTNEFEGKFECLGENTEKYKSFSVSIEKEVRDKDEDKDVMTIDKDGNKSVVTISYKIEFIDSARKMATSFANFVDNLKEGIHKIKCKDCYCFLEHDCVKDNSINYKCLFHNKKYSNKQNW